MLSSQLLAVVGLALVALLCAVAVLRLTRQRPLHDLGDRASPAGRRALLLGTAAPAPAAPPAPESGGEPPEPRAGAPGLLELGLPPTDPMVDRCIVACRRRGKKARFEAIEVAEGGDGTRVAASPLFAVRRSGRVKAKGEAPAMHAALVAYLQRRGWEAEASAGEDWFSTGFSRPRATPRVAPAPPSPIDVAPAEPPGRRELKAFTGLTGVQIFQLVSSLVTAPLIARALGAEGRGLLAAIAVPLGIAPFLLQFGLGAFAINRVAQGMSVRLVFGSLAIPTIVIGGATALAAPFIAGVLSDGREPVNELLIVGLALMPVGLLTNLAMNIAHGLSDWRALALVRGLPAVVAFFGVVALFALGKLTVESAAIVTIASGLAPLLALGGIFRRAWPPRVELHVIRDGLHFGGRAWVGTLATLANQRLDQLLMIPLVPARELGLYAVAVTISGLATLLTSQVVTVLIPRIAEGQSHLAPRAMRCLLLVVSVAAAVLAAGTLLVLVPVFGPDFAGARPLVLVLLVAVVPLSGLAALGQWLPAVNRPGAPSVGELVSLGITIPGLILLLPTMGAMGAALVSLVAYSTSFAILLVVMSRHLGHRMIDYLIPHRGDLKILAGLVRAAPLRPSALRGILR